MKRIIKTTIVIAAAVAVVTLIIRLNSFITNPLFKNTASNDSIDTTESTNSFNALLVGADASGVLADAILLVNINTKTSTASILSIPRDTKIYRNGKYQKINACLAGGIDCLIDEVKKLTGVQINYYAAISVGTLADIVDALGGVYYNIERDLKYSDPDQNLYINLKAGYQHLNGDMAEQYCRYRGYVMGDLERTHSQQKLITALVNQKINVKNIPNIYKAYVKVQDKVKTNVSINDIVSNIKCLQIFSNEQNIVCYDAPGEYNDLKKEKISYYLVESDNLNKLRNICIEHF